MSAAIGMKGSNSIWSNCNRLPLFVTGLTWKQPVLTPTSDDSSTTSVLQPPLWTEFAIAQLCNPLKRITVLRQVPVWKYIDIKHALEHWNVSSNTNTTWTCHWKLIYLADRSALDACLATECTSWVNQVFYKTNFEPAGWKHYPHMGVSLFNHSNVFLSNIQQMMLRILGNLMREDFWDLISTFNQ